MQSQIETGSVAQLHSILTGACARSVQFYSKYCLVHTQQGTSMEMVVNSKIAGKKNGSTYVVEKEICSDEKIMSNSSHQNFIEDISKPEVNVNLSQSLLFLWLSNYFAGESKTACYLI